MTTGMRELKSPVWMCRSVPQMPQDLTIRGHADQWLFLVVGEGEGREGGCVCICVVSLILVD